MSFFTPERNQSEVVDNKRVTVQTGQGSNIITVRVDPKRDTRWDSQGRIQNSGDDSNLTLKGGDVYAGGRQLTTAQIQDIGINVDEIRRLGQQMAGGADLRTPEIRSLADAAEKANAISK